MKLYLIRHGIAENMLPESGLDKDRSLTPRGKEQLDLLSTHISKLIPSVDKLVISPYLRAQQTAQIYLKYIDTKVIETFSMIKPEDEIDHFLEYLKSFKGESLIMVGHEPHIHNCLIHFLGKMLGMGLIVEKASVHCLNLNLKTMEASLEYGKSPQEISII